MPMTEQIGPREVDIKIKTCTGCEYLREDSYYVNGWACWRLGSCALTLDNEYGIPVPTENCPYLPKGDADDTE